MVNKKTKKKGKKRISAKRLCSSVIKREGVKKDGTLKKGYRYVKGGKVVKAKVKKQVLIWVDWESRVAEMQHGFLFDCWYKNLILEYKQG